MNRLPPQYSRPRKVQSIPSIELKSEGEYSRSCRKMTNDIQSRTKVTGGASERIHTLEPRL